MGSLPIAAAAVSLRHRLDAVSVGTAAFMNAAYGCAPWSAPEGIVAFGAPHAFSDIGAVLSLGWHGRSIELALAAGGVPDMLASTLDARLPEALQVALASAECAAPLRLLGQALRAPLIVRSVGQAGSFFDSGGAIVFGRWARGPLPEDLCAFALRCPDDETAVAMAAALRPVRAPVSTRVLHALAIDCVLVADAGSAPAAALADLLPGAAVVLQRSRSTGPPTLAVSLAGVPLATSSGEPRVLARGHLRDRQFQTDEVRPMTRFADTNPGDGAEALVDSTNELEVEVRCELARLSLTLGDIASLAPGMVVDLGTPLEGMRGALRAGGRIVAHGEVVALGENIALRITDVAPAR